MAGVTGFEPGEHLISDSCACLHLGTDQVRFYRRSATGNLAWAGTGDFRRRHGRPGRLAVRVLARLVPTLAVSDRCRIDGRSQGVRGELNTCKPRLRQIQDAT